MLATRSTGPAWRTLAAARWPSLCAVCHGRVVGRVCVECSTRFVAALAQCGRCALSVPADVGIGGACMAAPPAFDAAFARVDNGFLWDRLIADFRFHAALDLAPALAQAMIQAGPARRQRRPTCSCRCRSVTPGCASAATTRPGSWRGAKRTGIDADPGLLLRIRDTPHQLALAPDSRAGNVRGAFAVEPQRIAEVRDRAMDVVDDVDDVMTSGSTLAEIGRVLKPAGASRVEIWVIARTPRREDR